MPNNAETARTWSSISCNSAHPASVAFANGSGTCRQENNRHHRQRHFEASVTQRRKAVTQVLSRSAPLDGVLVVETHKIFHFQNTNGQRGTSSATICAGLRLKCVPTPANVRSTRHTRIDRMAALPFAHLQTLNMDRPQGPNANNRSPFSHEQKPPPILCYSTAS